MLLQVLLSNKPSALWRQHLGTAWLTKVTTLRKHVGRFDDTVKPELQVLGNFHMLPYYAYSA